MDIEHSAFKENIPAYALGALEPDDTAAMEIHLRTCEACRAELSAYRRVSQGLLGAVPPKAPPANLRKQLQAQVRGRRAGTRAKPAWSFGQVAMGLALLMLLGLNLFSFFQLRGLQQQQASLLHKVQTDQTVLGMLAYPGTQSFPFQSGQVSGSLLINKDENSAVLICWGLEPLPEGQTYQAWLVQPDGVRVSAAVFRSRDAQTYASWALSSPQSLNMFSSLGLTVEPAGGSPQPTGERILKVDF